MFYRSQLFVPGNRPDRFEKACRSGADLVCIDLEDAVGPTDKEQARTQVLSWLATTSYKNVSLRINSVDTDYGQADIEALSGSSLHLPFIMIPKVGDKKTIKSLATCLPKRLGPFFAIIESAQGLIHVEDIFSHPRILYGMYGAVDYAADIGCDMEWDTHLYARSRLVAAAIAHDVTLFDTPHIHIRDLDDCEASTRQAKALGILARSAIHPAQISRIHKALLPTPDDIIWARRVINADEASGGNVTLLDGKFIEAPIVKQAQRILALAKP